MRKLLLSGWLIFLFSISAFAQPDSCGLRITLLTCSPGEDLYSTFGHTALRVQDPVSGSDLVYNYGTFEFAPDFYVKFISGKLLYALSVESFPDFLYTYQAESRSVVEQDLLLPCNQKQALAQSLQQNALPQNRAYLYDFLFDNCTTRAGDMVVRHAGGPVNYPNVLPGEKTTFRNLLHTYLDRGGQYWSKLGIDLLLGARLDRTVTNKEAMFLPDYLMKAMGGTTAGRQPVATKPAPVLTMPSPLNAGSWFRPGLVFGILLAVAVLLSVRKNKVSANMLKGFDFVFFLVLGLAGLLLLFMWFGTDHKVCRDNLNLLWALPTHIVAAFYVAHSGERTQSYFKGVFWVNVLLLAAWAFLPQQLNLALLPLVALSALRSGYLAKIIPHAGNETNHQR